MVCGGVRRVKEMCVMGRLMMCDDVFDVGLDCKLYLSGGFLIKADLSSYFDGTFAGDYGFDLFGFGVDGVIK